MKRDERRDNGARPDSQITYRQRISGNPRKDRRTLSEDRLALEALARVAFCREALEAGEVGLAYEVLVDLENDLVYYGSASRLIDDKARRHRCNVCRATFRWPGELSRHEDVTGHGLEEAA